MPALSFSDPSQGFFGSVNIPLDVRNRSVYCPGLKEAIPMFQMLVEVAPVLAIGLGSIGALLIARNGGGGTAVLFALLIGAAIALGMGI